MFLTMLTGNPILSLLILAVFWWGLDRFTLGILPDPFRIAGRFRRIAKLRRTLASNAHDRRARAELADLLLARRRPREAADLLRYNVEQGDDQARTYQLFGIALMGIGDVDRAVASFEEARHLEPGHASGAIDLELGRGLVRHRRYAEARAALERFVAQRQGTVEGKVLLAKALDGLEDRESASKMRAAAWADYVSSPRFVRRRERLWAWRANPARPITYAAVGLAVGATFAYLS